MFERRARLTQTLAELGTEIELAREATAAAFRELKKYELVSARQEADERAALVRWQQRQLDDIGVERFRRGVGV